MENKVIAITGAASGMGREVARVLAAKGAKVSLCDVQSGPLDTLVAEITQAGGTAISVTADVRNREQVETWVKTTVQKLGKLDGAANLAGVIGKQNNIAPTQDIDDDDWDFIIGVNQRGLMNCMRAQIPHFNDGGSIVNAASVAGVMGVARNAAYSASKHAVIGLTRSAAKELGERQIRCNCFCPYVAVDFAKVGGRMLTPCTRGLIDTPMAQKSAEIRGTKFSVDHTALKRAGQPSDVASLVEFLLGEGSKFMTGGVISIDGGWMC